jgi:hypothetical protein
LFYATKKGGGGWRKTFKVSTTKIIGFRQKSDLAKSQKLHFYIIAIGCLPGASHELEFPKDAPMKPPRSYCTSLGVCF